MRQKPPIAVIGMAGIFPGATDLDTFWQNLIQKKSAAAQVPAHRWIIPLQSAHEQTYMPDKAISLRACLADSPPLDPTGLNVDASLLRELDPLYHILLGAGREAFSGCNLSSIDRSRIGVSLAAIALPTDASSALARSVLGRSFEQKLMAELDLSVDTAPLNWSRARALSSRVTSLPGAILAEALGLGGGSFTLDAACASSLYAVKLACDELQSGRADAMLSGGISRPDCLYTQIGFSQLRALSPSGRCAPFDAEADGLVVGEGAGILVLKRLADALAHGDTVYGVIRGIGLSNDMRGNLLAPDTEGQVRAMRAAYEGAGWSPEDADLIECHGAGTPVGDKTELTSLRTLWKSSDRPKGGCPIGSVKSHIGHLLTGAGAAGMIKTLLGMHHHVFPPSLNFSRPAENSPLINSPFRVQTEPGEWRRRSNQTPRRAGVSAFGFGGINAHLLFEEWDGNLPEAKSTVAVSNRSSASTISAPVDPTPVAIVGMGSIFGSCKHLRNFQEAIFKGDTFIRERPTERWRGADDVAETAIGRNGGWGGYMESLTILPGEFRVPPNEIPDILPQQLIMLKVAADALKDAGLPLREYRPRMGTAIGMEFDLEATRFQLRWNLFNEVQKWIKVLGMSEADAEQWLEVLREACGPPLTAARVLGSLGGIVASRVAREFRFGGPGFVVSADAASGIKALEIGLRSLQQGETDAFLSGAVDLTGDVLNLLGLDAIRPFSEGETIHPFDRRADGSLPGEGAVALVLKRVDQAEKDGDRMYAVIRGIGKASGGGIDMPGSDSGDSDTEVYTRSTKAAFEDAAVKASTISYVEAHGSGDPREDRIESEALHEIFSDAGIHPAVGSLKPVTGDTGAAAGLASVAKTVLCIYQNILPPLVNYTEPENEIWRKGTFHIPAFSQFWPRDHPDGPRRACVGSLTRDGNCAHVILEEAPAPTAEKASTQITLERRRPLGAHPAGLFVIEGDSPEKLVQVLESLKESIKGAADLESAARMWYEKTRAVNASKGRVIAIVAKDPEQLPRWISDAREAVISKTPKKIIGPGGLAYFPDPLGPGGEIAFVYPGSGNHYVGMGRGIEVRWPSILREMDAETDSLTRMISEVYTPRRVSWESGWEQQAREKIISDPLYMLFGQVVHGGMMTRLLNEFGIQPNAVIGYSLGESAGYFATGAWSGRDEMLKRMRETDLFSRQLAGPCLAARKAWNLSPEEPVDWRVAVINRPAEKVQQVLPEWPLARLLIINTPDECVIGGRGDHVTGLIHRLGCDPIFLDGVVTVHCDAAVPAADAYRELHLFPTHPPESIRYYSCALGRSRKLTQESAADSILKQALHGFNFPATVEQAYADGVRIFLEMGPQSSCTRMIRRILGDRPHSALSACVRGEDDYLTVLKFLGNLIAEGVPVDMEKLYGTEAFPPASKPFQTAGKQNAITLTIGGESPSPPPAPVVRHETEILLNQNRPAPEETLPPDDFPENLAEDRVSTSASAANPDRFFNPFEGLAGPMAENIEATAEVHRRFLEFSDEMTRRFGRTFSLQNELLAHMISGRFSETSRTSASTSQPEAPIPAVPREMCMEFAVGSVANVLGPEFAEVDTYRARVRLPDEPLMLVDRILTVEGEKGSLGSGRVVTEHDVLPQAWYLDGGRAPVCISVEAGQADLFLCSYLGIDLKVKGKRTYRLLDAKAEFHRGLPRPGETIRYEIEIDRFVKSGYTYMFFFRFEGYIGDEHLISMRDGCAGFFTEEEVRNSGGIILTEAEKHPQPGFKDFPDLVSVPGVESYPDAAVEALRAGDLARCFGPDFAGIRVPESLRLPDGRMRLLDRVLHLDPLGGRYGLGMIRAEADIHPDDWFLTCHFVDDMVMPGTLMYECCNHTLRVLLQRMGWVVDKPEACYEPVIGIESVLKCRGPVTPDTRRVIYEVEIKEMGFNPEPYVIADAMMFGDGQKIVRFTGMSVKLTGVTREDLESFWSGRNRRIEAATGTSGTPSSPLYTRERILAFAVGNPSEAFGERYTPFDRDRFIARLPGPPYFFMDRIISAEPEPWILKPGGWIVAEYDVPPDAWYFRADRSGTMPFCVLLEIPLQACGWTAAYLGSALRSDSDLKFRNLGGRAVLHRPVGPDAGRLTMRVRLTRVSQAGGMIIQNYDLEILNTDKTLYQGETTFGFFSQSALAQQVGIQAAGETAYQPSLEEIAEGGSHPFAAEAPLTPDDRAVDPAPSLAMPAKALRMIDRVDLFVPDGGPHGLGFIRGSKSVEPDEWFFSAHFYQDPVCPGSLGIESFLQLLKFAALQRWKHLKESHRFEMVCEDPHSWIYRGQIIQSNRTVEVDAVITRIEEGDSPAMWANGYLKVDGLFIYQMENFAIRLVPIHSPG